ncbi:50S ribosomal protein L23 [Thiocapsa imhoffii]|uniref:Large ribosomal subunit protein uL23 n=1 Tax=Thiocapsa imhoffii TaxID=382777 RepID=A0A9X0WI30_9GAMM|nr:50S ribosomal protein L23 [Thiocapsa imhoffii]MBK1645134.1 50S ribosomal protein L23 [Thiocapsa imhoffii]
MNEERLMKVLLAPLISEKTSRAAAQAGQYGFRVATDANKHEIASAVELLFNVKVSGVQVLNVKGKKKRHGQRLGKRNDWRKAYVRLADGQDIDFGGGA